MQGQLQYLRLLVSREHVSGWGHLGAETSALWTHFILSVSKKMKLIGTQREHCSLAGIIMYHFWILGVAIAYNLHSSHQGTQPWRQIRSRGLKWFHITHLLSQNVCLSAKSSGWSWYPQIPLVEAKIHQTGDSEGPGDKLSGIYLLKWGGWERKNETQNELGASLALKMLFKWANLMQAGDSSLLSLTL